MAYYRHVRNKDLYRLIRISIKGIELLKISNGKTMIIHESQFINLYRKDTIKTGD